MAMTINGTSGLVFPDSTTMATGSQAVRAWVNFNGTGTVAIRAAYNVTSITDNGTGDYTVNFTTALPDANYSVQMNCGVNATQGPNGRRYTTLADHLLVPTTFAYRFIVGTETGSGSTSTDPDRVFSSAFR